MSYKRGAGVIERPPTVLPLVYSPAPGWKDTSREELRDRSGLAGADQAFASAADASLAGVSAAREKELRDEGFREGLAQAHAELETAIRAQKDGIAAALREFSQERDAYFHHVEGEVVALALAIVRKILRRESQVDPLLLSGLVRVALEKTSSSHTTRLRVHPSQMSRWKEYFSAHADLPLVPALEADAALEENQCRLETDFGSTDIDVETQVKEIEQGLFDLLAQRPPPR